MRHIARVLIIGTIAFAGLITNNALQVDRVGCGEGMFCDSSTLDSSWVLDHRPNVLGDDNQDGRIDEDESGWDCHTMGNRVCG